MTGASAPWLLAAGFWLGTATAVPRAWRVHRRRSAADYSDWALGLGLAAMLMIICALTELHQWWALTAEAVNCAGWLVVVYYKCRGDGHVITESDNVVVASDRHVV